MSDPDSLPERTRRTSPPLSWVLHLTTPENYIWNIMAPSPRSYMPTIKCCSVAYGSCLLSLAPSISKPVPVLYFFLVTFSRPSHTSFSFPSFSALMWREVALPLHLITLLRVLAASWIAVHCICC